MAVPSGVHSWLATDSSCFESTSASPPSGRIAWTCPLPSTLRRKVIQRLSGDHSMSLADSLPRVSWVTVPVLVSATNSCVTNASRSQSVPDSS